ncbi:MAG: hypothetical protein WD314_10295 [Trueperaceae bacterium]
MKPFSIILQNLAVLAVFVLALVGYGLWRSDARLVDRDLPVHYPEAPARGALGEVVESAGVTVTVLSAERRRSSEGTGGLVLSSRAKIDDLTDFVTVTVAVSNGSDEPVSLDYYGTGQRADVLLGARKPAPRAALPLLPNDVRRMGAAEPLPARVLEPGESVSGSLVYPVNRQASELALAILPARSLTATGHTLPSFEIDLEPPSR